MSRAAPKPLVWMANTREVVRVFPAPVREVIGYALYLAQTGDKHVNAKPLKGFGPGVLEVVSDHQGDTFRAVYVLRLAGRVYVLHAFQKKSRRGISTPKAILDTIRKRLAAATELHSFWEK